METEIYNRAARLFDLQAAAALSLLQLGAVAIVLAVASMLEARAGRAATLADERDVLRRPTGSERVGLVVALGLGALFLGLPLAVLVERSLGNWGALFEETPALLVEPWRAAEYSIAFAGVAAADRARRRRARGRRARPAAARESSTGSSCSRSAPRP